MPRTSTAVRLAGQPVHRLGIDVDTKDMRKLLKRLGDQANTVGLRDGGAYHMDPNFSQLWIDTRWTEKELDDWLYRVKHGCDYVGTWERRPEQEI
jgi:hypothetical protein